MRRFSASSRLAGLTGWLRPALPAWVATRLGMAVMTVFTTSLAGFLGRSQGLLHAWFQWDTGWYLTISARGYFSLQSANFFPLYPALVEVLTALLAHPRAAPDSNLRIAVALGLSSVFAAFALAGTARLALDVAPDLPGRAALALGAFPTAFFLTAAYTESLFAAVAAGSLLLARRRLWVWAAACAILAGLTRPTAVILVLPLAWEARRRLPVAAAMAFAPLAGIALFAAYLGYRFGDPLLFAHTQTTQWHHQLMAPWETARLIASHVAAHHVGLLPLDLGLWLGAVAVLIAGARRLPLSFTLLAAGAIAVAVAAPVTNINDVIPSVGRYLLAAPPLFAVLAGWMRDSRYFEAAYLVCALLLQAGLLIVFMLGGPVM